MKKVFQTLRIEDDEEEAPNTDEDMATLLHMKKYKVHSNYEQPIPILHYELEPAPSIRSPQQTNIVSPPFNFAPVTPTTSNSNTSHEMIEATLVEHFASLCYKTHHFPF